MDLKNFLPKEKRIRVGLIGFGKTGRAVAEVLLRDKTVDLCWVVRQSHSLEHRSVPEFLGIHSDEDGHIFSIQDTSLEDLQESNPVDAIVDFSSEAGMDFYLDTAAKDKITVISAISNLSSARISKLKRLSQHTKVLWSPNITLGINFLIIAAKTLKSIAPSADISILEEHFKTKEGISGTALKIADELDVPKEDIKSVRAGGIIGLHEVLFGFPFQTVRIKHESISREAFGNGAIFALKEMSNREPGFHKMEDVIGRLFADTNAKYADPPKNVPRHPLIERLLRNLRRERHRTPDKD